MLFSATIPTQDRKTHPPVAGAAGAAVAAVAADLPGDCHSPETDALSEVMPLLGDGPHPVTGQWGQV